MFLRYYIHHSGDREADRGGSPRMIYESSTCWLRVSEGRQHGLAGQGRR